MAHAERCPVCEGSGKVMESQGYPSATATPQQVMCHGCGGDGWVIVTEPCMPIQHADKPVATNVEPSAWESFKDWFTHMPLGDLPLPPPHLNEERYDE